MVIRNGAWTVLLAAISLVGISCSHADIRETSCSDGFDNDGDGQIDFADPDCSLDAAVGSDGGSGGCDLPPGSACSESGSCCGDPGLTTQGVCADLFGSGYICRAVCANGSDCNSSCCYELSNGTGACGTTLLAPSGAHCMASVCCAGALTCTSGTCR